MKRVTFEELKALQATGKIKLLPMPTLQQPPPILQHDQSQSLYTTVMYSQSTVTNSKITLSQQLSQCSTAIPENFVDNTGKEDVHQKPEVQANHQESVDAKIVWTRSATFALLSAYESRDVEADRTKKIKNLESHC